MERYEVLNQTLKPVDKVLDVSLSALRKANLYAPFKKSLYEAMKVMLSTQFRVNNRLKVFGTENVPMTGGVILAANHASWLDAQVVSATCPRKVSFIAKSEFTHWPVLHHMMDLMDAVYVRRGGDEEAMQAVVQRLRQGTCIAIFPEGTIPGEEDIPRWEVEPETGLLRGKTGVVRLAMAARVPVVPVGLSGTGKAFPPEAYPRLQEWPLPRPEPIEVRFGDPIWFRKRTDEEISYEQLRGMTSKVMRSISQLVNHTMGYESMTVPVEEREVKTPVPKTPYRSKVRDEKARLGVLVLHGFTSDVSCVADLRFPLDEMGIPYRIPILRGHGKGKEWQALAGVQAQDWYDDAEASMFDLLTECRKVVVVGLSMGGLVALDLAARHRKQVAAVVTIAAALRFKDPLSCLTPVLARVVSSWPSPRAFTDRNLEKERNRNYPRFPTKAFHELYRYAADMENRLSFVVADALILQSKKDTVVHPKAANIIHEKISSKRKTLAWFEESGHEMLLDLEAPAVLKTIAEYVKEVVATSPPDGE